MDCLFPAQVREIMWNSYWMTVTAKQWNLRPVQPTTFSPEALAPFKCSNIRGIFSISYTLISLGLSKTHADPLSSKHFQVLEVCPRSVEMSKACSPHQMTSFFTAFPPKKKKGQPLQRGTDSLVHERNFECETVWAKCCQNQPMNCGVKPTNAFSRSQWPWSLTADLQNLRS